MRSSAGGGDLTDRARNLGLSIFLVALAATYGISRSGLVGDDGGAAGAGLPSEGIVAGLGDSVAAGYGLGPSSGYPDNPQAYPLVLAEELGWEGFDFAIVGACAASPDSPGASPDTQDACVHSILADQLPRMAEVLERPPTVITMTVGANDLRWVDCLLPLLSPAPLPFDPCPDDAIGRRLAALQHNLSVVLEQVAAQYPDARIVLTEYYHPLPGPPTEADGSDVCTLFEPVALLQRPDLALEPFALQSGAGASQAQANAIMGDILARLNEVIRSVAQEAGVPTVPLDFGGHDMCRSQTGGSAEDTWVYGPSIQTQVTLQVPPAPTTTTHWDVTLPTACPDPSVDPGPFSPPAPLQVPVGPGSEFTMDTVFLPNCAPHPTVDGQEAIARAVLEAL
jgi:lysophospholipase L1-like esterase